MKRILLAAGMGGAILFIGALSGLGTFGLVAVTAMAGGFGWVLGGLPSGPSGPESHTGAGPDGTQHAGGGDAGGGGGESG